MVADRPSLDPRCGAARSPRRSPERSDQVARRAAKGSAGSRPPVFDPVINRQRNLVERCFNRLEQFRAIANRYAERALAA
ncbi:transposase [Cryptosporangium phraense]|uniref:transposase n=1 Tax=Cryptosporangium phraense TaxID=2593070 RepID=UPI0014794D86|nr:transposase [Cryptosporangium phraense]